MDGNSQSRPLLLLRTIGLLNLTIAFLGLMHLALTTSALRILGEEFVREFGSFLLRNNRLEYMSAATILCLVPLAVFGYFLYQGKTIVIRASIIFFAGEVLLFAFLLWRWDFLLSPFSYPVVMMGLMNFGIFIQIVTAYPLICIILLARQARPRHSFPSQYSDTSGLAG